MEISERIKELKKELDTVTLVAVSKTHPITLIQEAYQAGQRVFGENRVQELVPKYEALPKDIQWHLIGSLQTNKVKYIASFVYMIQSVDSLKLLETIDKEAQKHNRKVNCLLQVYIAQEETKHGFDSSEIVDFFTTQKFNHYKNIEFSGLMGMATNTDNLTQVSNEFRSLNQLFTQIKNIYTNPGFSQLSMGMSSDYKLAIKEGATIVRIGSTIFGNR
jgi:pyridoxal phosphate enzyme (YggS family)